MHKGNHFDNKVSNSPYMSWLFEDRNQLKRGGTAPIIKGRKNRTNIQPELLNQQEDKVEKKSILSSIKNLPNITSFGPVITKDKASRETCSHDFIHKTVKTYHQSMIDSGSKLGQKVINNTLRKSSLATLDDCFLGSSHVKTKEKRKYSIPVQQHPPETGLSSPFMGLLKDGNFKIVKSNRPQTSYLKDSSAFRRSKILEKSFDSNQRMKTENLNFESPHFSINKNFELFYQPLPLDLSNSRDKFEGMSGSRSRNLIQDEKHDSQNLFDKLMTEKIEKEKTHEPKILREKTAEAKFRLKAINNMKEMDSIETESSNFSKDQADKNADNHAESLVDGLVSKIERIRSENINSKKIDEETFFYKMPSKSIFQQEDSGISSEKDLFKRPPARKNVYALNLDGDSGNQAATRKKSISMKSQTINNSKPIFFK